MIFFFAVVQSINTGLEKLNVMDMLPNDSIIVSGKGRNKGQSDRSDSIKFLTVNRMTGNIVSNVSSARACMPDGMAVFTTADGSERVALSYGYCISYSHRVVVLSRTASMSGATYLVTVVC